MLRLRPGHDRKDVAMRSILLAAAAAAVMAASAPALAGWSITGDAERFRWTEGTTPGVTETGPRFGIGVRWIGERPWGWQFAYQGRIYGGTVHYQGFFLDTGEPTS